MPQDRTLSELSAKQRRAVAALVTTGDASAACAQAGIARDTLYRWLKQPAFAQAVREAEASAIDDLSRLLVRLSRTATATLAKAMTDPVAPYPTRVRAADVTLNRLLQLRELATLEARVTELEQSVGLQESGQ